MKKYIFKNPISEAIRIQGKRWVILLLTTIALLLLLSVGAFFVEMPIWGTVTIVAAVGALGFCIFWFGFEMSYR